MMLSLAGVIDVRSKKIFRVTVYFLYGFAYSSEHLFRSFSAEYCYDLRYIFTVIVYFVKRSRSDFVEKVTILVDVILGKTVTTLRAAATNEIIRATCNS